MPVCGRLRAERPHRRPQLVLHYVETLDAEFFLRLGSLGDIIPLPIPPFQNVASIGDLFLTAGLGFFLFATLLRRPPEPVRDDGSRLHLRRRGRAGALAAGTAAEPGLAPALDKSAALERPLRLGSSGAGLASPAPTRPGPLDATAHGRPPPPTHPIPERFRQHPYVRLALNGSFSALWFGQLISLFGDRVNQIALAAFVFEITKSPLQVALTFVAGLVPNLLFSPVAGALVDRWEHKQVLVVSDILRASLRAPGARRDLDQHLARLPDRVPDHDGLAVLPTGPDLDPAARRPRRRAALGQLGDVGGRDDRGRRQLPARRPVRAVPRQQRGGRLLVRRRDLPRVRRPARDDGRPAGRPSDARRRRRVGRAGRGPAEPEGPPTVADIRRDLKEGWALPAHRGDPPREHAPGDGGTVRGRRRDGLGLHHRGARSTRPRETGHLRVHGDRDRRRATSSAASRWGSSRRGWPRVG